MFYHLIKETSLRALFYFFPFYWIFLPMSCFLFLFVFAFEMIIHLNTFEVLNNVPNSPAAIQLPSLEAKQSKQVLLHPFTEIDSVYR